MGKMGDKLEEIKHLIDKLQKEQPDSIKNFLSFMTRVEKPAALDTKQKELINESLAVAAQCEWYIALQTKGALDAAATREGIEEAALQAVLMHGGPALMYMTPLMEALDEFTQ